MPDLGDIKIAGFRTCREWNELQRHLVPGGTPDLWERAFEDFYRERLQQRYLRPIEILREHGGSSGVGFSIVAIQCSLVEFLESTLQGRSYRRVRDGDALGPYEYGDGESFRLFSKFLRTREPFRHSFNYELSWEFYSEVRCPLLHEARIGKNWKIAKSSPAEVIVDASSTIRVLYRNNFQEALLKFIEWHKAALLSDVRIQQAFIRKFNNLCN